MDAYAFHGYTFMCPTNSNQDKPCIFLDYADSQYSYSWYDINILFRSEGNGQCDYARNERLVGDEMLAKENKI